MTKQNTTPPTTGLLLAGGRARRMDGRDKGLLTLAGRTLAWRAVRRLRPQVDEIIINANRNRRRYAKLGFPVVADDADVGGFAGPLAGVLSGLRAVKTEWLLSVPCDAPFFPRDLAQKMHAARRADGKTSRGGGIVAARAGGRDQPVFLLLHKNMAAGLADYLSGGGRKIDAWYSNCAPCFADFDDEHAFANVNDAAELARAEGRWRARADGE